MAETEDYSNKRKASPESTAEDGVGKRARLEDGGAMVSRSDEVDNEVKEVSNKPASSRGAQDDARARESPRETHGTSPDAEPRRSPEAQRPSAASGPPTRRNISLEEKRRGQRLFGGLVNTLSRTTSATQQQRRLEIERRQHEKAQQRRAEDEKRRIEKLERLKKTREIEQVKLDERAMKARHETMLDKARSLHTRSEPRLYYLPWELTREQEDIINDQVRAAEETVERERREFRIRKEQRLRALGVTPPPRSPSPAPQQPKHPHESEPSSEPKSGSRSEEATVGEPKLPPQDTNPDAAAPPELAEARDSHNHKDHDEHGDEIMQDEEDVVIY
ncbi:pinin/SDK/memA/ protein conserved region-domain-containing protein [Thermothelomyces heterothallicus CBS 202.75]|uniref:pinin/SDK/memA/ protein conserved region-domain-containing protein n=1 Tax=Thermothelomyces heterothallicus CBS 202.75 TaxID=1149848 RepID=UPI003741F75A